MWTPNEENPKSENNVQPQGVNNIGRQFARQRSSSKSKNGKLREANTRQRAKVQANGLRGDRQRIKIATHEATVQAKREASRIGALRLNHLKKQQCNTKQEASRGQTTIINGKSRKI